MHMTGRCLCGNITYIADAEPAFTAICHCKVCQRQAGTAFATLVAVPKEAISVSGTMKTFTETGGSGQPVYRRFCPDCGSPLVVEVAVMPDKTLIAAGTLDDTSFVRPTMNLFCEAAQSWVPLTENTPNYPRTPE